MPEQIVVKISTTDLFFTSVDNDFPAQETWAPDHSNELWFSFAGTTDCAWWYYDMINDVDSIAYLYALKNNNYYRAQIEISDFVDYLTPAFLNGNIEIAKLDYSFNAGEIITYNYKLYEKGLTLNNTVNVAITDEDISYTHFNNTNILAAPNFVAFWFPNGFSFFNGFHAIRWGYTENYTNPDTYSTVYMDYIDRNGVFNQAKIFEHKYSDGINFLFDNRIILDDDLMVYNISSIFDWPLQLLAGRLVGYNEPFDFTIYDIIYDDANIQMLRTNTEIWRDSFVIPGYFVDIYYQDNEGNYILPLIVITEKNCQRYYVYNVVGGDNNVETILDNFLNTPDGSLGISITEFGGDFILTGGTNPVMFYATSGNPPSNNTDRTTKRLTPYKLPCAINCVPLIQKK